MDLLRVGREIVHLELVLIKPGDQKIGTGGHRHPPSGSRDLDGEELSAVSLSAAIHLQKWRRQRGEQLQLRHQEIAIAVELDRETSSA